MVKDTINRALSIIVGGNPKLEFSTDEKNGHLTTNCALVFGKEKGINPKEFAEKIKKEIEPKLSKIVEKIEIAGPGFINFFLKDETIEDELHDTIGKVKKGFNFKKGEKINIEFISANPTGELHIGHGRGAFYGDALSNILEFSGGKVTREYYINDSRESNQIKEIGKTALGLGETYLTPWLKKEISNSDFSSSESESAGSKLSTRIQKHNQKFIEDRLRIKFDIWYSEDEKLRGTGANDEMLVTLEDKKLVEEKDGAIWLKTSKYGDDENRVIIRSDGSKSYFLSDITYHNQKFNKGFDTVIDVWGADHHGHVKRMMAVKKMLDWKGDFKIFITQLVSLKDGKMSKRAGNVVLLRELVEEISLDVVRWFFNEKSINTHMEFDMDKAREQSEKNPVFYVQYAHARINSIIEKAKKSKSDKSKIEKLLENKSARNIAIKILQFGEVLENISENYQVNNLTTYVYELANSFSQFYRDVRVVDEDSYNNGALLLSEATKYTIAKSLALLGISAPEKM